MADDYPGLVDVRAPEQVADALMRMIEMDPFTDLRKRFETRFTVRQHLQNLADSLHQLDRAGSDGQSGS
jgi:hypothetical protein